MEPGGAFDKCDFGRIGLHQVDPCDLSRQLRRIEVGHMPAAGGTAVVNGQHGQSLLPWRFPFPQIDAVSEIPLSEDFRTCAAHLG